jgi:large conductance mechanosensitive channel
LDIQGLSVAVGGAEIKFGMFIQTVVDFFIITFCIFGIHKARQKEKRGAEAGRAEPTREEELLAEIRDLFKKTVTGKLVKKS